MLSNKLALVTGASSGIGKSIAKLYAKNGASLCLVDMESDNLKKIEDEIKCETTKDNQFKIELSSHVCDVSNSSHVEELFKSLRLRDDLKKKLPNIIVNSAGITRDQIMVKMSEKDFDKVIQVNLKGTFLINQHATRYLIEQLQQNTNTNTDEMRSYASIINIASVIGKYGNIGQVNYAASKAGVEGMTKTVAKELGKYKIRCNAILPGFIQTPMTDYVPDKVIQQMLKMIPLRRIGKPDDVAQLALFLASDASSYITGASIECSGGIAF